MSSKLTGAEALLRIDQRAKFWIFFYLWHALAQFHATPDYHYVYSHFLPSLSRGCCQST